MRRPPDARLTPPDGPLTLPDACIYGYGYGCIDVGTIRNCLFAAGERRPA